MPGKDNLFDLKTRRVKLCKRYFCANYFLSQDGMNQNSLLIQEKCILSYFKMITVNNLLILTTYHVDMRINV